MVTINEIIKEVANNTGIDKDLVDTICKHPFLCTVDIMKDKQNIDDILFNKLFKFKLKRRYKENKNQTYSSK